jgi:nitroreductase
MDLNKAIQSRRSIRKYKSKKPDWQKIIECIDAARYAPMAGNNYTLKFILVEDQKIIQEMADCAQQDFIATAPFVVVVCSNPKRTINAFGEKGKVYTRHQAGAAIQNFLLKIVDVGLSACWIGHFSEGQVKRDLKIPEEVNVEAIIPVGYEYEKVRTRKAKIDLDRILYFHKYGQSKKNLPNKMNV